jgi:hypothetical protein
MNIPRFVGLALLVVLAVAVLAALFVAYQHPAMLVDFSNLMFCG